MDMMTVTIRAYGPLNDFLAPPRRQVAWPVRVEGNPSVKDLVEAFGISHPEIDLLLVNDDPAPFDRVVRAGDRVAVYPRFLSLDVGGVTRVRAPAPAALRFVADVHLGKLARRLRLLGFDTVYRREATDGELADLAVRENRILLTRDQALLKRRTIRHGCYLRSTGAGEQAVEVLQRFGPAEFAPFTRCTYCNGALREAAKASIAPQLPPRTREHYDRFRVCDGCGRAYWEGAHWRRLVQMVDTIREASEAGSGQVCTVRTGQTARRTT